MRTWPIKSALRNAFITLLLGLIFIQATPHFHQHQNVPESSCSVCDLAHSLQAASLAAPIELPVRAATEHTVVLRLIDAADIVQLSAFSPRAPPTVA